MTETPTAPRPEPTPLPQTGGSWVRDAEGRLTPATAPRQPRKPTTRRAAAADPVKEG